MSGYVGPVPHLLTTLPAAPQYLLSRTSYAHSTTGPTASTLGITAPHNRTYPEYSWLVLCVVSAMPLVYYAMATCCTGYRYVLHTSTPSP
jgi:hypothetical protein